MIKKEDKEFTQERERMVQRQLARRGIKDKRVLEAMRTIPRHLFVPPEVRHLAYSDGPLPIGEDQTISQPYVVGLMTELVSTGKTDSVLEIGTGSGYQAAVLSKIFNVVYTFEYHTMLANQARMVLNETGCSNVQVIQGDGSVGFQENAPYQAILLTAAAPAVPQILLSQLDIGGLLVAPVGSYRQQVLERYIRLTQVGEEQFEREEIIPVAFVPLLGEYGWRKEWWGDSSS